MVSGGIAGFWLAAWVQHIVITRVNRFGCTSTTCRHYSGVTWAPWRLKAPTNRLFIQQPVHANNSKYQSSASLALCDGNPLVIWGSPQKGPVMRKLFPYHHGMGIRSTQMYFTWPDNVIFNAPLMPVFARCGLSIWLMFILSGISVLGSSWYDSKYWNVLAKTYLHIVWIIDVSYQDWLYPWASC